MLAEAHIMQLDPIVQVAMGRFGTYVRLFNVMCNICDPVNFPVELRVNCT